MIEVKVVYKDTNRPTDSFRMEGEVGKIHPNNLFLPGWFIIHDVTTNKSFSIPSDDIFRVIVVEVVDEG